MNDLAIRKADRSDAPFLAWSILTATRSHLPKGWFDIALARPEHDCLEFLMRLTLATHLSPWHYSGFWVAEVATGLAAALFSARAVDVYPTATIAIRDTLKDLGLSQAERALFWRRGAYLLTCPTRPDDHSLTIENSATVATCRGRGYTSALLARAFDEGRSSGLAEAQISCFIGNHAAERAYEKAGFIRFRERRHPVFEATAGSPGMQQFMKAL